MRHHCLALATLVLGLVGLASAQKKDEAPQSAPSPPPVAIKTGEHEAERLLEQHPEVRVAQSRVSAAQAELDKVRRDLRQQLLEARERLELLRQKHDLAVLREKSLDAADAKGKHEVQRELKQLQVEQSVAQAALDRLRLVAPAERLAEKAPSSPVARKKLVPLPKMLKQLKQDLEVEMDIDFSDVEPRDAKLNVLFDIISKRYKLTIFNTLGDSPTVFPIPKGRMTVAAFLQRIEDSMDKDLLIVRDYGICVIPRTRLKADMLTYREFRRDYLPLLTD